MTRMLTSAFAQQPSTLEDPVPREPAGGLGDMAPDLNTSVPEQGPDRPAEEPQAGLGAMAPDLRESNFGAGEESGIDPDTGVAVEPDSEFLGQKMFTRDTLSPKQISANRLIVGMLGSDTERMQFLQDRLGKENVRKSSDNFLIRPPGQSEFVKLDSESFELVSDLFVDESREMMVGAAGVAGAVGAFGATPGHPIVRGLVGAAAGVAAATGASRILDETLGYMFDIKRDPERGGTEIDPITLLPEAERTWWQKEREKIEEAMTEGSITLVTEGIFRGFGRLAKKSAVYRKAAKELREAPPTKTAREAVEQANEAAELVNSTPGTVNIPGSDQKIAPVYILGEEAPEAHELAESVMNTAEGKRIQEYTRENLKIGVLTHLDEVFKMAGGTAEKLTKNLGTGKAKRLSGRINRLFDAVKQGEGAEMNRMLRTAEGMSGPNRIFTNNTSKVLQEMGEEFRLQYTPDGRVIFPEAFDRKVSAMFGGPDTTAEGMKGLRTNLKNYITKMHEYRSGQVKFKKGAGGMPQLEDLADFNDFVTEFNGFVGKLSSSSGNKNVFHKYAAKLNKALRTDRIDTVDMKLSQDPGLAKSFADPIAKYRDTIQVEDTIARMIENNQVAQKAFVKGLFTPGRDGLENLVKLKAYLGKYQPDTWESLKVAFIDEAIENSLEKGKGTSINMQKFRKNLITKFGDDYVETVFGNGDGNGVKRLNKLLMLGERFESLVKKGNDGAAAGVFGEMVEAIPGVTGKFGPHSINAASAFLRFGSTQRERIQQVLQKAPVERYLKGLPPHEQTQMSAVISGLINGFVKKPAEFMGGRAGMPIRAGISGALTERNNYVERD